MKLIKKKIRKNKADKLVQVKKYSLGNQLVQFMFARLKITETFLLKNYIFSLHFFLHMMFVGAPN